MVKWSALENTIFAKRIYRLVPFLAVLVVGFCWSVAAAQMSFDPQSLIGRWEGAYQNRYTSNSVVLQIKKIEGDRLYGTANVEVEAKLVAGSLFPVNQDVEFTGTISGRTLSLALVGGGLDFQVKAGDGVLKGSMTSRATSGVELHKVLPH